MQPGKTKFTGLFFGQLSGLYDPGNDCINKFRSGVLKYDKF